jgi:hypothetical protein
MFGMVSVAPASEENLAALRDLISLLSDPKTAAARIAEFAAAADELRKQTADARTAQAELANAETAHAQALEKTAAEAAAKLAHAQATFDRQCTQRENALAAREQRTKGMESKLAAELADAAAVKADLSRRLTLLQQAGAA